MKNGSGLQTPIKELRKDLHAVARDAESLLKATASVAGDQVQQARARTERTVKQAFDRLYDRRMQRRVRRFASTADTYVRDNSWTAIGVAAGVGLLIGLLARRR